jgi:spore germination cell wall hydrolase CwlJ-like protein
MAPSRAVAVQPPYADAADVALFAADMPLPAKLTVGKGDSTVPSYYSPLVPRTFDNGKAFGGLDEEEFQRRERRCMVTALYFEARSESDEGQIAVGQVIMNRVKSPDYPDTICGVVYQGSDRRTGCQFSFTCDGRPDRPQDKAEWERSIYLANLVLEGKVWLKAIGESTHYHANYVNPAWRREMDRKKKVGHHIFYRSPEVSITAPYQLVGDEKRS